MKILPQIFTLKNIYFILFGTLLLSSACSAQETEGTVLNRDSVIAAAREIMELQPYCALITLDSSGLPNVRTMNPYPLGEDMTVWMATNRRSRKTKEILNNSSVCLYFADHKNGSGYVAINGKAIIIDDKDTLVKKKRDYWEQAVPDWKNVLILIKIIPEKLEVVNYKRGLNGNPDTWKSPFIEFEHPK